jgi:GrpB-like predicted nucleotidyltransferase (UPF0157 family)
VAAPHAPVAYDPRWPALFSAEKRKIMEVIGDRVIAVEHIGSTAVPGLGAAPTLDIMVGVRSPEDLRDLAVRLETIGYTYQPEYEAFAPERRYFEKGPLGRRTHQMHVVVYDGEFWSDRLLFRDYLRTRPEEARRYYEAKVRTGERIGFEKLRHADPKTEFIHAAIERARKGGS